MACADGIQEYIETLRDLKANNAESSYLKGLRSKIRSVEKGAFKTEITTAVFVTSAGMVLKFGIATVALVGTSRLVSGKIDVLTLFMFLLVASVFTTRCRRHFKILRRRLRCGQMLLE